MAPNGPSATTPSTVEVTSPHADVWYRYPETETAATCAPPVDETVRCDVEPDRASVSVKRVDVRFQ
jgi:hypothetical protein